MATAASPRLTAREGRSFAWTLAAAFAVLAALFFWRDEPTAARVLGVMAVVSFVAGATVPTRLGAARRGWMALGVALSRVTTPVFFTLIYIVVLAPAGFLRRSLSRSPLARDRGAKSYWIARERRSEDERSRLEHQF